MLLEQGMGNAMTELDVTWRRVAAIWWLLFWRGMVGGFLLGAIMGAVVGLIGGVVYFASGGRDPQTAAQIGRYSALALAMPLGLWWYMVIIRMALRKKYTGFRIVLVAYETVDNSQAQLATG
jgi:Na+/H+-translocating membrane pyrophosphatase